MNCKEPLAIVGIGCRFPGNVTCSESFWKMMRDHTDTITDVPADRWDYRKFFDASNKQPGKTRVKQGGYLQQPLNEFDPLFFGISPREAAFTDPQQRLLLEVTWEAFEDAGLTQETLQGSNTGVYIGAFNLDNLLLQLNRDNLQLISGSTAASVTMTMLSNRLSYTFDLKGPSITMDTACSSSMVSTHYACQSLWHGECDMAIAGGVNIISRPEYMVSMSKGGFLSPHGRCKSFDEDAQGYVRSEGAGILIIKTLQQALNDRDNIYSLICNTGVNQDGYTQNGISFPSSDAQRQLIQKVYSELAINPLDVSYIEAHGTGTQAGDPIEMASLASLFTHGRDKSSPCYVGSVKSNIGHTESAAGVAGIIKAALSVNKGAILPNLHFNNPNPKIDFADGAITVPVALTPWSEGSKPRMASVNSFGYGGTNGHLILQQYIDDDKIASNIDVNTPLLIPISAKTPRALNLCCQQLHDFLNTSDGHNASLADINYSLAYRRTAHNERLAFIVHTKQELQNQLAKFSNEENLTPPTRKIDTESTQQLVFVFTGMGPQWWGMGQELYQQEAVFKQAIDDCDQLFLTIAGWSIKEQLLAPEAESNMASTRIAQPANFVIQVALLELYRSWGVTPAAVVGHSVGEVASAYASGALSLKEALIVSFYRSQLQQRVAGQGSMLAIGIGAENAQHLASLYDKVSVAAINSASSVTLSGNTSQLQEIAQLLNEQNIFNRILQVEVAYHSYQMDAIEADLYSALANLHSCEKTLPLYSTALGKAISDEQLNADYWWKNVRNPVYFEQTIKQIIDDGYVHFLEVGPHPVTHNFINECLTDKQVQGNVFSSLVRKKPEQHTFFESLAKLFNAGFSLDWPESIKQAQFIRLPSYPWQRENYWNESPLSTQFRLGNGERHPYLFERLMAPEPAWQVDINGNFFPFLQDHKVAGHVVFPGAGYIEAGLALQYYHKQQTGTYSLENLKFYRLLILDNDKTQQLRITENQKSNVFSVYSRETNSHQWTLHATGQLLNHPIKRIQPPHDLSIFKQRCTQTINRDVLYSELKQRGLDYGAHFQTLSKIYTGEHCVFAKISNQSSSDDHGSHYCLYPTLLDGAFQSLIALTDMSNAAPMVPIEVGEVTLYNSAEQPTWCYGEVTEQTPSSITCHLQLFNDDGQLLAELTNLICTEMASEASVQTHSVVDNYFYHYQWASHAIDTDHLPESPPSLNDNWIIIAEQHQLDSINILNLMAEKGVDPFIINLTTLNTSQCNSELIDSQDYLSEIKALFEQHFIAGCNHLVYFVGNFIDTSKLEIKLSHILNPCLPLISLAQSIETPATDQGLAIKASNSFSINLNLVSCGLQVVDNTDDIDPTPSSAAALIHLLGNEIAAINPRHIDLPMQQTVNKKQWAWLVNELIHEINEEDIALRADQRFVKQLNEINLDKPDQTIYNHIAADHLDYNLAIEHQSTDTQDTVIQPLDIPKPEHDQLHIQLKELVVDNSLFQALSLDNNGSSTDLHTALATVISTGVDVTVFNPGDTVIVLLTNSLLSSQMLVHQQYCMALDTVQSKESALDFTAYATALHIMDYFAGANIKQIFIQDAFNPIGLALVHFTLAKNITIFATADTPFKREYLQSIGVQQVFDHSDLTYITDIQQLAGQSACQVVMNNLGNDHFHHCLKLLSPNGRLIQIASTSLTFPEKNHLLRNYNYSFIDFADAVNTDTHLITRIAARLKTLSINHPLPVLPKGSVSLAKLSSLKNYFASTEAFTQSVVKFDDSPVTLLKQDELPSLERQATYLITGGTSGLGLEIARWLITQGCTSLVLASRNGSSRAEAKKLVDDKNNNIRLIDIDITDSAAVNTLVNTISNTMFPLKGVIHCAMVLDDDLTIKMNCARMQTVMAPKVLGALNLHNATKHLSLDQFINISSISSIIGNVGQTNYVAANAFLDSFAYARHCAGLPATTINLGVLQEIGVVARDSHLASVLEAKGIHGLATKQVLRGLSYIINSGQPQLGLFYVNWSNWAAQSPKSAASSRFRILVNKAMEAQSRSPALVELLNKLEGQENYFSCLIDILSNELSRVIKIPSNDIPYDKSISDLGIDSLMSVELSSSLREKYGLEVTSIELLSGPSLDQLTDNLVLQLAEVE